MKQKTISIKTGSKTVMVDITAELASFVKELQVEEGIVTVYSPHTTAGLMINESCDPDVVKDIIKALEKMVPEQGDYKHLEGNSPAHIKSVIVGNSVQIPIVSRELLLGTWQGVFFCEFDGPRKRNVRFFVC
jgi:secondary thiamine-phosphate synthase enzyme